MNPFLGIYSAVTRRSFIDGICYMPEERLTVYEAVSLFTTGSAYAIGKEAKRGQIAKGYEADFTILDRNIFEIEAEEIKEVQAEMTVIDAKLSIEKMRKIYERFSEYIELPTKTDKNNAG